MSFWSSSRWSSAPSASSFRAVLSSRTSAGSRSEALDSWSWTGAGRNLQGIYEGDAFFAFHHINAWQDRNEVVLDVAGYPDAAIVDAFYLDRLRRQAGPIPTAAFRRYRIPLRGSSAKLKYEVVGDESIELPRIHYARCNARPYQFAYGVSTSRQALGDFLNQLVKVT